MAFVQPADESKVLVIYTGGTIGMLLGQSGYVPEPLFLTETLRSQARFHDPLQASLFSHSSSVQGWRNWNATGNSGRSSPNAGEHYRQPEHTLSVRSCRPIGALHDAISVGAQPQQPTCIKIDDNTYEAALPSLVTPKSSVPGGSGKRIRYAILEWNPLLDSSNININDWIRLATEIEMNYATFDAFVVLHGTDTMAYTSSALSFLLEDLGKTVILTGAQIPLSQLRNDAVDNLLGALVLAGHYIIPECSLFFNHTLYRGNRVTKSSSFDFNAFTSPNFPALVNVGIDIVVNWNDVLRQTSLRRFQAHKDLNANVVTLRLFPGISSATVRSFLSEPTQGVILETFGAGNAPQRDDLMSALKEACDRGVVIVAISQCAKGSVSDAYETGRTLLNAGVVAGGGMTTECALAKLSYLLSKPNLSRHKIRQLIGEPIRGELTRRALSVRADSSQNNDSLSNIQSLLSQVVRLAALPPPMAPGAPITPGIQLFSPTMESIVTEYAEDGHAPWSSTAGEAAATEAALLPFLMHAAAARDDIAGIAFCLGAAEGISNSAEYPNESRTGAARVIPGGIVNCIDAASGRSPLHTAALNGSVKSIPKLLEAGALVHLRDGLGHTALYYAARQGHEEAVDLMTKAGANLGGSDIEGGFAALAYNKGQLEGAERASQLWVKAGLKK